MYYFQFVDIYFACINLLEFIDEERRSGSTSVTSSVAQSPYLTSPSPGGGSGTEQSGSYVLGMPECSKEKQMNLITLLSV